MSHSLQTLEPQVVCQISEALMLTHGTTTTREVKKELREHGFFAVQAEVSAFMEVIAEERRWKSWFDGRYQVYAFAEDTRDKLHQYLKNGEETWEILVQGNQQIISEGNAENTLPVHYQEFPSNRYAFAHASGLLLIQESKGFVPAAPPALNLQHRFRFREWIKQEPVYCVLSFRDGQLREHFPAHFHLHDQTAVGRLVEQKKVGYAITLDQEAARMHLEQTPKAGVWLVPDPVLKNSLLLGEQPDGTSAYLASGEALGHWHLLRRDREAKHTELYVPIPGIYKAEMVYPNGRTLVLSYQDWKPETELWPLVLLLLGSL